MKKVTITLSDSLVRSLDMFVARRKQIIPSYNRVDAIHEHVVNMLGDGSEHVTTHATTFVDYLMTHLEEETPIGDLARDVEERNRILSKEGNDSLSSEDDVAGDLLRSNASVEAKEALQDAIKRFFSHSSKSVMSSSDLNDGSMPSNVI